MAKFHTIPTWFAHPDNRSGLSPEARRAFSSSPDSGTGAGSSIASLADFEYYNLAGGGRAARQNHLFLHRDPS